MLRSQPIGLVALALCSYIWRPWNDLGTSYIPGNQQPAATVAADTGVKWSELVCIEQGRHIRAPLQLPSTLVSLGQS